MTLLDTNVISELMREVPHNIVIKWLDQKIPEQTFILSHYGS